MEALVGRKDLNLPHAAAMWDWRLSGCTLVGREDLNGPHAAAMWDWRLSGCTLVGRKDLKLPHAAAMWDWRVCGCTLSGREARVSSGRCARGTQLKRVYSRVFTHRCCSGVSGTANPRALEIISKASSTSTPCNLRTHAAISDARPMPARQ